MSNRSLLNWALSARTAGRCRLRTLVVVAPWAMAAWALLWAQLALLLAPEGSRWAWLVWGAAAVALVALVYTVHKGRVWQRAERADPPAAAAQPATVRSPENAAG